MPRVAIENKVSRVTVPEGSLFKGDEPYQVQDLVIIARVVRYRRERWLTPTGETIVAPLLAGTCGPFGPELRRYQPVDKVGRRPGDRNILRLIAKRRRNRLWLPWRIGILSTG